MLPTASEGWGNARARRRWARRKGAGRSAVTTVGVCSVAAVRIHHPVTTVRIHPCGHYRLIGVRPAAVENSHDGLTRIRIEARAEVHVARYSRNQRTQKAAGYALRERQILHEHAILVQAR